MFVGWYSSDGSRPGFGCFGLPLLIVPLLCVFGGLGDSSIMFLIVLIGLFVMFVLPRLSSSSRPAYAEPEDDKRKNEEEYLDKPKRDDDYIVGADGEVMEVIDEQSPNYNRPPAEDVY